MLAMHIAPSEPACLTGRGKTTLVLSFAYLHHTQSHKPFCSPAKVIAWFKAVLLSLDLCGPLLPYCLIEPDSPRGQTASSHSHRLRMHELSPRCLLLGWAICPSETQTPLISFQWLLLKLIFNLILLTLGAGVLPPYQERSFAMLGKSMSWVPTYKIWICSSPKHDVAISFYLTEPCAVATGIIVLPYNLT